MKRRTNPTKSTSSSSKSRTEDVSAIIEHQLNQKLPGAIQRLAVQRTEIFSGPIPKPEHCEHYERIHPGFTDRVLTIAEKAQRNDEQAHRRADWFQLIWRIFAMICFLLLVSGIIASCVWLLAKDKSLEGFGVLLTGIAGIIWAIHGQKSEKQ